MGSTVLPEASKAATDRQDVLSCLQMLLDTHTNVRLKRSSWCAMGSGFRDKGARCGVEQAGDTPGCPCVQPVPLLHK